MTKLRCGVTFAAGMLALASHAQAATVTTSEAGGDRPVELLQPFLNLTAMVQTEGAASDLGSVRFFAGNRAATGFVEARGQTLERSSTNAELFNQLGYTYGFGGARDGSRFQLPDLRGRTVVGTSATYSLGTTSGAEATRLTVDNLPAHRHSYQDGTVFKATEFTGGDTPFDIRMPGIALDFEIVTEGDAPDRSSTNGAARDTLGFVIIDAALDGASEPDLAKANGLEVPITAPNSDLFSLLGTTYGGDGRTRFAYPDTEGRVIVGQGQGPGLSNRRLGEAQGQNQQTLTTTTMPSHLHALPDGSATDPTGGGQSVSQMQEYLTLNWIIALEGADPFGLTPARGEPFLGEMALFAGNFAPRGWAFAHGQLLAVTKDNEDLFSILGTIHGGDGRTTFGLPDLRGRVAVGAGTGIGLSPRFIGSRGGSETLGLTANNLPAHSHVIERTPDPDPNVVPLPAGLVLILTGFAALSMMRRRA